MFEKEAEEYVIKKHRIDKTKLPIDFSLRCEFSDDFTDFQKGAEYGYNKAFVEADKNLKAIVTDFNKARELIEELSSSLSVVGECEEEECELLNRAEQFLKESE